MPFYHRRCGNCGRDVTVYTSTDEHDVLCQQCRMEMNEVIEVRSDE